VDLLQTRQFQEALVVDLCMSTKAVCTLRNLCAGFLIIATLGACTNNSNAPSKTHYKMEINSNAWTPAGGLTWPSNALYVNVIMGATEKEQLCNKPLTERAAKTMAAPIVMNENNGIANGKSCNQLWVLFSKNRLNFMRLKPNAYQMEAIAAHEAFHLIVQRYGKRRYRFDNALDVKYLTDKPADENEKMSAFLKKLIAVSIESEAKNLNTCTSLTDSYNAMQWLSHDRLQVKTQTEWPAEFYTHEVYFKNNDNAYQEFRKALHDNTDDGRMGYLLYTSAPIAVSLIERKISRSDWQKRYVEGETMLNLLFESLGCDKPHKPVQMITLNFKNAELTN
jgi:hypothetical protein